MSGPSQRTVSRRVTLEGAGLHSGEAASLTFCPGEPGSGLRFRRTDLDGAPEVPRTDVVPQEPNRIVNINDALFVIFAFQADPYPFGCPDDPCQDNILNPCP